MFSCAKVLAGLSVLLAVANSFADSASGLLMVKVSASSGSCTSSTAGTSSVSVVCPANVFVNISQASSAASIRFMPEFRPARDTLLPDYCRSEIARGDEASRIACRLGDQQRLSASAETDDDGWTVESRLYAVNTDGEVRETLARLRKKDDEGILTGIRVASADGRSGPVEMLVSF